MPGKEDAIAANRVRKGGQNGVRKGGISPKKGVFLTSGGGLDGVLARPKGLAETQKCHNLMYRSCVPTTAACLPLLGVPGPIPLLGVPGPIPLLGVQGSHTTAGCTGSHTTVFGPEMV